jgi:hypothetical protein
MSRGEKREHEDVRIPEDVPPVGRTREASRSDRCLAGVRHGSNQMEEGETDCELEVRIAFDDDVGLLPTARPGFSMLSEETLEPSLFHPPERLHSVL